MKTILKFAVTAAALSLNLAWAADATLDAAAKEAGSVVTGSGLVYLSLKDGTGTSPAATDTVKVNYRGTFPDGKEFDSSYKGGKPIEFPLHPRYSEAGPVRAGTRLPAISGWLAIFAG